MNPPLVTTMTTLHTDQFWNLREDNVMNLGHISAYSQFWQTIHSVSGKIKLKNITSS